MDFRNVIAASAIVNAALGLTGIFVAGFMTDHAWSWRGAILSAGLAYFSGMASLNNLRDTSNLINAMAALVGIASGLWLLV